MFGMQLSYVSTAIDLFLTKYIMYTKKNLKKLFFFTFPFFSLFSNAQSDSFHGVRSQLSLGMNCLGTNSPDELSGDEMSSNHLHNGEMKSWQKTSRPLFIFIIECSRKQSM
jgi:hypothetical protein